MTFVASVAAGAEAADTLAAACRAGVADGSVVLVRHDGLAVAWSSTCRWLDASDDGRVLAVLDGSLHDQPEAGEGQAKLLAEHYRRRGVEVARGLLGDFVGIVLDRQAGRLLVARDPLGVRPWYQADAARRQAGASDVATLAGLPWVDTAVNERIAIEYLAAVEESRGETLHRGIGTLRPGHTWHWDGERGRTFRHHCWEVAPDLGISWGEAAERCRATLGDAVRARVAVTGAATSELSGGLDSSAVVGTLVLLGRRDVVVGRMVFDGPRADERAYSDAVIDHWGLTAVSAPPWVPTAEERERLSADARRPTPDANFTMFVGLHRALLDAGRHDGLTGLGGDDAFLASSVGSRVVSALRLRRPALLAEMARLSGRDPRRGWSQFVRPTLGYLASPWRRRRRLPRWVSPAAAAEADLAARLAVRAERVTGVPGIDERLRTLTSGYDASILETRAVVGDWVGRRESHPFLDPRLIEATYGLDPEWPTKGGHDRALEVAAFSDRLPPVVARRRSKAEFSEVFWPQLLDDATVGRVGTGPLRDAGWLDAEGFRALVSDAKRGMANAAVPLSRCVSLDHWLRNR